MPAPTMMLEKPTRELLVMAGLDGEWRAME
jgi:hypothetical protein